MPNTSIQLYLNLLKQTLTFALWPTPPIPLSFTNTRRRGWKRWLVSGLDGMLQRLGWRLDKVPTYSAKQVEEGRIWPGYAHTMVGRLRLDNLQACMEKALADDVPGDFIETGVWRGGACIFMRGCLAAHGVADRRVFVADSFAGLPPPDADKYPADAGDIHHTFDALAVSLDQVKAHFDSYGLLDEQVVFLKGWFKDTLPTLTDEAFAVIRLDGDMYESTMDGLRELYPRLSSGGFCIIDDYGAVPGCAKAVEDYRQEHGITEPLESIDWTGRFWRKR